MIQIIKHFIYLVICEFIELAVINMHARSIKRTVDDVDARIRRFNELRWN